MYVETDFILALLKDDDWLQEGAEEVYKNNNDLWTSKHTLVEIMIVSYREGWSSTRMVSNAANLVDVEGDTEDIKAASTFVEQEGFTPFDALHLVKSGESKIVSSDQSYDNFSKTLDLSEST